MPENFVDRGGLPARVLDACRERVPLIPHGVSLSVGGDDPYPSDYIDGLARLLAHIDAPYYSDHLCYARTGGSNFWDLLPLPFTDEAARHVAKRVGILRDRLKLPIVLENITYYAVMPTSELTQGQLVTRVLDEADAGLLLDLNNVYLNAVNHDRDPFAVLEELPLHRARHIHLAGYLDEGDRLLDNHGAPVDDAVWALYERVMAEIGPIPTLVEWDTVIPPLERVVEEAAKARAIMVRVCGTTSHEEWSRRERPAS